MLTFASLLSMDGKYKLPFMGGNLVLDNKDKVLGYESKNGFISKKNFPAELAGKVGKFLKLLKKKQELLAQINKIDAELETFHQEDEGSSVEYEEMYH
jgi:hypothetical protein